MRKGGSAVNASLSIFLANWRKIENKIRANGCSNQLNVAGLEGEAHGVPHEYGSEVATVLVVEDEELICDMIADGLTERGFQVYACKNADEALHRLAADGAIDLLFTDINLPGRMDGSALARRAHEMRPDLPVVYASGRVHALDRDSAVADSVFVSKPCTPTQICSALLRLITATH